MTISVETLDLTTFVERMGRGFGGGLIDQAFQPNVAAGHGALLHVAGSRGGILGAGAAQFIADVAAPPLGMNSAKAMHGADAERFAGLRTTMEGDWTPGLQRILDLETRRPAGAVGRRLPPSRAGRSSASPYVLCEINVSSVRRFRMSPRRRWRRPCDAPCLRRHWRDGDSAPLRAKSRIAAK